MKRLAILAFAAISVFTAWADEKISVLGISLEGTDSRYTDQQYPASVDYVYGWRLAFLTGAHKRMIGLSTAIIGNDDKAVRGYVGGLQFAVGFNQVDSGEFGLWQIAVFHNGVRNGFNGLQCSVFHNLAEGYFNGLQIAVGNEAESDFLGAQLGLINKATYLYGAQLGLYNESRHMHGFQLGVINYAEECKCGLQLGVINAVMDNKVSVMPIVNGYF